MRIRMRLVLAAAVLAAAATTSVLTVGVSSATVADGPCPASTNWDNIVHMCN